MKLACLTSLGILIGLLTLHTLFAQSNTISLNQWNEEGNQYSNISSYTKSSNFAPQMQMDPGIVEGIEDILRHDKFRKVIEEHSTSTLFTIRDNGNICSKKVVGSVSSSSCSNQVLRLRGGGLQQSRPKGELKNTGDTSDKEIVGEDKRDSFIVQLQLDTMTAIEDVKNLNLISPNRYFKKSARNKLIEAVRWLVEPSERYVVINKAVIKMLTKEKNEIFKDADAAWNSFEESRIAVRDTNDAVKAAKKAEQDEVEIQNNVTKQINNIKNSKNAPKIIGTITNLAAQNNIIDTPISEKNIDQAISGLTTTANALENLRMADKKRKVELAVNHSSNVIDNLDDSEQEANNKESQAIKEYASFVQTIAFRVKQRFPRAIPFEPIMSVDAEEKIRIAKANEVAKKIVFDQINGNIETIVNKRRTRASEAAEARNNNRRNILTIGETSLSPEEVNKIGELRKEEKELNDLKNRINQAEWDYDIAKRKAKRICEREDAIIAAEKDALRTIWQENEKYLKKDLGYYQNKTRAAAEKAISKAENAKKLLQQYEQNIRSDAFNNEIYKISSWFNEIREVVNKSLNEAEKATEAVKIVMQVTTIEEAENKAKEAEEARDKATQGSQRAWIYYTPSQNQNFIKLLTTNIDTELFKENANKERQEGNTILADYWTSTTDAAEKVILYCKNANNNIENGNIILAQYWTAATENAEDAVTYLKNAIKANKIGNSDAAFSWNEASRKALEASLNWQQVALIFQNKAKDQGDSDDLRHKALASFDKFKAKALKDIAFYNKNIAEIRCSDQNKDIINQLSIPWQLAISQTEDAIKRNEQYMQTEQYFYFDIDYTDLYFARFGVNNGNKDKNGNLLKYWNNVLQTTNDIIECRSIPNTWSESIESAYRKAAVCWINAAKEDQYGDKNLVFYWVDAANSNNNFIRYKLNAANSNNKLSLYWVAVAKIAETVVECKINAAYAAKKGNIEEAQQCIDQANVEENFIANGINAINLQGQGKETLAECYLIIDKAKRNIYKYKNNEDENYNGEQIGKHTLAILKNSWMEAGTVAENIEIYATKAINNSENKKLFQYYFNAVKATEAATKNRENIAYYLKNDNSDEVSVYKLIAESYESEAALWIKAAEAVENNTSDQVYIDKISDILRERDKA